MHFRDLLRMSLSNLWRRKLRTLLTVLGVLIGTTSIVVMLSIGFGQKASLESSIDSSTQLTAIDVQGNWWPGMPEDPTQKKLNDDAVAEIAALPDCAEVAPVLTVSMRLKSGAYENYLQVYGLPADYIDSLDLQYEKGGFPEHPEEENFPLVIGSEVNRNFYNPKASSSMYGPWMQDDYGEEPPPVDMYEQPVFALFEMNNYSSAAAQSPNFQPLPPKKVIIQARGVLSSVMQGSNMQYSWAAISEIESLKNALTRIYKNKAWPNQPSTKNGRSTGEIIYETLHVKSVSLDKTRELMETIRTLGYNANSAIEYIQEMQAQSQRTQMLLGGIGGISLFVAAIGIANTMMMSIYERTREIGIFKVLGLEMGRIRDLFLLESGLIGLIGGVLGAGLSYLLSFLINHFASGGGLPGMGMDYIYAMSDQPAKLSIIPLWLVGVAMLFGIVIGMISGLLPALRAMHLSPLEAIRTE